MKNTISNTIFIFSLIIGASLHAGEINSRKDIKPVIVATFWSFTISADGKRTDINLDKVQNPASKQVITFDVPAEYISAVKKMMAEKDENDKSATPGKVHYTYYFIDLNNPTVVITDVDEYLKKNGKTNL
jgi:hypothetical protein